MASELLEIKNTLKYGEKCVFCNLNIIDEFHLGKIYKNEDVIVHYFCLLFSSHLPQNGTDEEGILGFLLSDIKKEVKKNNKTVCSYCYLPGATLVCRAKKCKVKFHLPCGVENNSFHTFYGQFNSYCSAHRRVQVPYCLLSSTDIIICVICQADIEPKPSINTIWAPCCGITWLHRECVQRYSLSAGYFFKCPNCNNGDLFRQEMLECGIYIPDQDASWETEPDSFRELYERHNTCDADECLSPKGRSFTRLRGKWKLILCNTCGSQGIHKECGKIFTNKFELWTCCLCSKISGLSGSKRKPMIMDYNMSFSGINVRCVNNVWSESSHLKTESQNLNHDDIASETSSAENSKFQCSESSKNLRNSKTRTFVQRRFKRKVRKVTVRRIRCKIDETDVLIPESYKKILKEFEIPLLSHTYCKNSTSTGASM